MNGYIVALRYTKDAGAHAGIVTWTSFKSKEEFDAWRANGGGAEEEVLEEGITPERAIELTRSTPIRNYIKVAVAESKDSRTGLVNLDRLNSRLLEVAIATRDRD